MLTVTYGQLRDGTFARALTKLASCSGFRSPVIAVNIAKINKAALEEAKTADEIYQKLILQYCNKDEAGKIIPHDGREGTFVIPDANSAEWTEKIKEFHAISFNIDRAKIELNDVQAACPLSPLEINALDPVLTFDEAAATAAEPTRKLTPVK